MFLVVGVAIAGAVGIAAAFYFSLRSGSGGKSRLRSIGAVRAGTGRRQGSRSVGTARPDRTSNARRAANGSRPVNTARGANASSRNYQADASTGPNPVLDFDAPAARPRRRVSFRKGADVDEELWPAESFGGVTDEQFWDDLASDKPLTTTARTAQQDPGTRNRPSAGRPSAGRPSAGVPSAGVPSAGVPSAGVPAAGVPAAGPPPVAGLPAATQPVRSMASQVPGATQPVRTAAGTSQLMSAPGRPVNGSQPVSAAAQPAEPRGRRRASRSDDEDPLTSAAFSLRSSGPVDGRSSRRSRDIAREQYDTAVTQETQTFTAAETEAASGGYPGGVPPFRRAESPTDRSPSSYSGTSYGDQSSVTQAMNTPPYGENYDYGSGGSPAQPAQPAQPADRRHNGTRSHARHGSNDETSRPTRQAYPQDGYQGTGSYPVGDYQGTGSYPAGGYPASGYPTGGYPDASRQGNGHQGNSHQGNSHQGNGHRAPYDPRDDYRRLTHLG